MKVEVLETKLSSHGFYAEAGDRLTIPDLVGIAWCANGWAKDLSGAIPSTDRVVTNSVLNPEDVTITITGDE